MTSSFLQRLRGEQGLADLHREQQLHYRLSADGRQLSLLLARALAGGRLEDPRPYSLQPAHWQQPPGFLANADLAALPQLAALRPREAGEGRYLLPDTTPRKLWHALADSGRLHLADAGRLRWGAPVEIPFGWLTDGEGRQRLDWQPPTGCVPLPGDPPLWLLPDRLQLAPLAAPPGEAALAWLRRRPVVAPEELGTFITRSGDELAEAGLPLPRRLRQRRLSVAPGPLLALSSAGGADRLRLQFVYSPPEAEFRVQAGEPEPQTRYCASSGEFLCLERNPDRENAFRRALAAALAPHNPRELPAGGWTLDDWRGAMTCTLPALREQGWQLEIAAGFRQYFVTPQTVELQAAPSGLDWFELALQVEVGGELIQLLPLLADCARRYSRAQLEAIEGDLPLELPDGRRLLLPAARLARWLALLGELRFEESTAERLRLPRAQLDRLHHLADGDIQVSDASESLLQEARQRLESPPPLPVLPAEFRAQLRPYQRLGAAWLQQRSRLQLGGLLADDMGLGKTVQLLAHLSLELAAGRLSTPALVVAPSSLLDNWRREAERFAPQLRLQVMQGPGRHHRWNRLNDSHLLLTSYALLARDMDHWRNQTLSALILDEAQAIKNPRSQIADCARELEAGYKLCVTGTPVENHLGELWSLFECMLPGFLGGQSAFRRCYRNPIEKDGDEARAQDLLERVAPFMLRRTKEQVAPELPPKTEITLRLPLKGAQRDLYETLREEGLRQIHARDKEQGRLLVLNLLTRLRLLCCDPSLVDAGEGEAGSAKRRRLREMLPQLVEEGRGVLVFSQFVGMLELLAADLQELGIDYLTLTGRSRNRGELVRRFQAGEAPVFLISLKAGGTGLNLTRADTVIHCDPWWNAAAESQASDRAHRIGQDKPVFVYKLLAEGTVEEKMQQLQSHKKQLSAQLCQAAEANALDFADLYSLLEEDRGA